MYNEQPVIDNPVITIAGVVPGNRGPSLSIAGATMGTPTVAHWFTAYPNGESIYVRELRNAERRAVLAARVTPLQPKRSRRGLPAATPKAA
ncbi:MAG TPA: hypothetical protein VF045_09830 [Acidimicrobiales bacterium]|jgi:hypothetical protein